MEIDVGLLRATEDAVDALSRLDEQVAATAPGLTTLLKLRSAQAIVAANDRPPGAALDGEAAFAALLAWWYAPEGREFIAEDPHLRGTAVSLDAAAEMMRAGHALTPGLLEEAMRASGSERSEMPVEFEETLRAAEAESWPALLTAAALSAADCGRVRTVAASIARAVVPLSGAVMADAIIVSRCAENSAGALHSMANEARATRRRVAVYREACANAAERCGELGRGGPTAAALAALLAERPAITVAEAAAALTLSVPTAGAAVERLMSAGLLREITGRGRDRVFVYLPAVAMAG
ncbi:MAG: MarR family transcriptional regulator [Gemmatimonadaceae bacterium]|nr:MarR family transcriptional regulator [Gemmatimonadaceae bacterium]